MPLSLLDLCLEHAHETRREDIAHLLTQRFLDVILGGKERCPGV